MLATTQFLVAPKPAPPRAPLRVYFPRVGKDWLVVRFWVDDYRAAMLEALHWHTAGLISYPDAKSLQRKIIRAVMEARP